MLTPESFFATAGPRVFAHRGLAVAAPGLAAPPENSLAAFRAALAAGASHLETDIRLTRDGVPVLFHDPEFRRARGGEPVALRDATLAELRDPRRGPAAAEDIPTLAEALEALPGALFNIDFKTGEVVEPAAAVIRAAGAEDRVLIASFSGRTRSRASALLPRALTSVGQLRGIAVVLAAHLGATRLSARLLRGVDALQIPEYLGPIPVLTPRLLSVARAAGVEVHVWTVNEAEDIRRLFAAGVDGIITDRADLASPLAARIRAEADAPRGGAARHPRPGGSRPGG